MKNICIMSNRDKDPDLFYTKKIADAFLRHGCSVQGETVEGADLIVVLGGDGSILRAARRGQKRPSAIFPACSGALRLRPPAVCR